MILKQGKPSDVSWDFVRTYQDAWHLRLRSAPGPSLASGQGSVERPLPVGLEDSSIRSILAHTRGNRQALAVILRQRDRDQPRVKLDELADSLLTIALQNPSSVDSGRFSDASGALLRAGARGREGRPYTGALDRLVQIHQRYPSELPGHSRVVEEMLTLSDTRAVDYVFRVATGPDRSARYAMGALLNDIRTAGRFTSSTDAERAALHARLRALWDQGKNQPYLPGARGSAGVQGIPNPGALANLQLFAKEQGWPR